MKKTFHSRMQVRGYELDGYNHVNHAVYLNYFEYARWCMIEEAMGKEGSSYFKDRGMIPVIARAEVDYRAACFLAEWLMVETELIELRSRVAIFEQRLYKEKDKVLAARAKMTLVAVDSEGKATSLPSDFSKYYGDPGN